MYLTSEGHRDSGGFEHSFQKWCVAYWGEKLYNIEKEAKGEGEHRRPDVVLRLKKPNPKRHNPVYVEVQRDLYANNWLEKTLETYKNDCLIIISVTKFEGFDRRQAQERIGALLEADTIKDKPKKIKFFTGGPTKPDDYHKNCVACNGSFKKHNLIPTTLGDICSKCNYKRRQIDG